MSFRAELLKIRTLRSAWVVAGIILVIHLTVSLQTIGMTREAVDRIGPDGLIEIFIGERRPAGPELIALLVGASAQLSLFLPVPAAVIAGQEFRAQQLGATLLAMPRRGRLLAAKSLAFGAFLLVVLLVMIAVSNAAMYAAIKDWHPGLLLTGDALRGQAKFVVFALLYSLLSFALTVMVRSTLIGIVVTTGLMAVTMTQVAGRLGDLLPLGAGLNLIQGLTSPYPALGVIVGWALVASAGAWLTLERR
jgi:ABC-2 type transport system permease protein